MGSELMLYLLGTTELVEVAKTIFAAHIDGLEVNSVICAGNNLTARENIHRKIHSDRARMKQVQRPEIKRAASQIYPACGVGDDGIGFIQLSVKNWARLRNFL